MIVARPVENSEPKVYFELCNQKAVELLCLDLNSLNSENRYADSGVDKPIFVIKQFLKENKSKSNSPELSDENNSFEADNDQPYSKQKP